ncbi:MAG: AAA family ATPase [Armatimonadota bacterium]
MLTRFRARGFKSLVDLEVEFPRLTVLFGPNASGKSNIIEAAQLLSAMGTSRTLADAFGEAVRGYPVEAFTLPGEGLPALLAEPHARLSIEAQLAVDADEYTYRVGVETRPAAGNLKVCDEFLLRHGYNRAPRIEVDDGQVYVRAEHRGRPAGEPLGNYTKLSDRRLSGSSHRTIERCRAEFEDWRVYYLDPRTAMREAHPPAEVRDIGATGAQIAPYLHRLSIEEPQRFDAVRRTLRALIPSIEDLTVDLDDKRGELDIQICQEGCEYSSRIISEGTLRVLALCAIAVNPWAGSLVAFEEPENGVHPRRLELIAELLVSLASEQDRQVIVTTHSARFCGAVLRLTRDRRDDCAVMSVGRQEGETRARPVEFADSLFEDSELLRELSSPTEDGVFEGLLLRGMLDE